MAGVRTHQELDAWQLADTVRAEVLEITASPAFRTHIELRTQLRRAIDSACTNIAEGFSRYQPRDIARFLRIAKASLTETIEHLTSATNLGLIDEARAAHLKSLARRSRGATTQLIRYLENAKAPK